jgi:FkbM family methyltransferase
MQMLRIGKKYVDYEWLVHVVKSRMSDAISSIGFKPYVANLTVNNISFQFIVATPLSKSWYATQENLNSYEMQALSEFMKPQGSVIFECGGHHGRDCVLLASMAGRNGHVVTFEPHPANMDVLCKNIEINCLDNVTAIQAAVGSRPQDIFITSRSNAKVSFRKRGINVPVITIDEWAEKENIWPDIIKIDVEGYEMEVLKGSRKALSRTPAILVELHCNIVDDFGFSPEDIWALIDTSRYNVYMQKHDAARAEPITVGTKLSGRPHLFFVPR